MSGCTAQPMTDRAEAGAAHVCQTTADYTAHETEDHTIRVYDPNRKKDPDIWQGPVCITNKKTGKTCGYDLSLIKQYEVQRDKGYILVETFSGSNTALYRVEIATCGLEKLR
ncbi:MAG: hypothetical protein OEZ39_16005 [Gammaproteobacteria bacterium]|nr:hypothetical protein [Gammaproteobacteria bacterium]MDH5653362.1 hypothetical protein [Gammaproteobacteria bacterium]